MKMTRLVSAAFAFYASVAWAAGPPQAARPPLAAADLMDIATLLKLEDTRRFDETELTRLLASAHPEVRRRAVLAVARIVNPRGFSLLEPARADGDVEVRAAVAFAAGQLKDAASVAWLSQILSAPSTPATIAREAARSLGKMGSPEALASLARYLDAAPATSAAAPVVGEALLAIGRFSAKTDVAPVVRWAGSADRDVRWRAAWALFRLRNPAAVPRLLRLTDDADPEVRFWAVRGLAATVVAESGADRATASARLRAALGDGDRRVRTEAVRALVTYDDDASLAAVLAAVDSPDSWIAVSAAESLGRFSAKAELVVPKLLAASAEGKPVALRVSALQALVPLAPDRAVAAADALIRTPGTAARSAALQALRRLGDAGRAKLDALAADPATRDLVSASAGRGARAVDPPRTDADYRRIVERWIVPDYNGAPKPRVVWDTPRGSIEIELYAGDAPLGLDYLMRLMESGEVVGAEFGRVVPNFVAQQNGIGSHGPIRDEVNRLGLTAANLSWASAGLDTGRPGYTLGTTPQPHNEGNFTTLGRVVGGMDVVDRLELGDAITGARVVR